MSENEMDMYDEEVFSMVNNAITNRPVAVLVPMEKVQQLENYDRRMRQMKRVASVVLPLCIGPAAVGAMARNLMSPGLTICVLSASVIWAAVKYWRGANA